LILLIVEPMADPTPASNPARAAEHVR
jgi:hypothetical protein